MFNMGYANANKDSTKQKKYHCVSISLYHSEEKKNWDQFLHKLDLLPSQ